MTTTLETQTVSDIHATFLATDGRVLDVEQDEPTMAFVDVSPTMATAWLTRNVANRHIDGRQVALIAKDMTAGRYVTTGQCVQFSTDGVLFDGQHRLGAVVASGKTIRMSVAVGMAPEARDVVDIGRKRTVGMILALRGHKEYSNVAACSRITLAWRGGHSLSGGGGRRQYSDIEIADFATEHMDLITRAVQRGHYAADRIYLPVSAVSAVVFHLLQNGVTDEKLDEFFEPMYTQMFAEQGDPRLAMLRKLSGARGRRERIEYQELFATLITVWNLWVRGEKRTLIRIPGESTGAVKIPEPIIP